MRILAAVDGSVGSREAARLIASAAWPPGTTVTLISVVDPGAWIPPGPGVPGEGGLMHDGEVTTYYLEQQVAVRMELEASGLTVESMVERGRPSNAIIEAARQSSADLVVIGSRGHGRIATLLLGSVSAAVVDRAPCPVLVARGSAVTRVLLALDGSRTARTAAQIVATWPAFASLPITVLAVAEEVRPWSVGVSPAFLPRARRIYQHRLRNAISEATEIAEEAVAGLEAAGRTASADVRSGEVSAEIIGGIQDHGADLVVIGCRGRTRLRSMLLGSVARDVVIASRASVLVIRNGQKARAAE